MVIFSYFDLKEINKYLLSVGMDKELFQSLTSDFIWKKLAQQVVSSLNARNEIYINPMFGGELVYKCPETDCRNGLMQLYYDLKKQVDESVTKRTELINSIDYNILKNRKQQYHDFTFPTNLKKTLGLKCIVLGLSGSGKYSICNRMVYDQFSEISIRSYDTPCLNKGMIQVGLWLTVADDDYSRLRPLNYPCTDAFLLCFCFQNRRYAGDCVAQLVKILPEILQVDPNPHIVLVGTMHDMLGNVATKHLLFHKYHDDFVSREQAELFAEKIGALDYVETSALTGMGTKRLTDAVLKACALKRQLDKPIKKCLIT